MPSGTTPVTGPGGVEYAPSENVGYAAATPAVVVGSPASAGAGSIGCSVGVAGHSAGAEEPTVAASCRSRPQFEQPNLSAAFTVEHRLQVHPSDIWFLQLRSDAPLNPWRRESMRPGPMNQWEEWL